MVLGGGGVDSKRIAKQVAVAAVVVVLNQGAKISFTTNGRNHGANLVNR